jgi:hypothetical protein
MIPILVMSPGTRETTIKARARGRCQHGHRQADVAGESIRPARLDRADAAPVRRFAELFRPAPALQDRGLSGRCRAAQDHQAVSEEAGPALAQDDTCPPQLHWREASASNAGTRTFGNGKRGAVRQRPGCGNNSPPPQFAIPNFTIARQRLAVCGSQSPAHKGYARIIQRPPSRDCCRCPSARRD